jgi:hypothetical protein
LTPLSASGPAESPAAQFVSTLSALGEKGLVFAQFLRGRLDILPDDYIERLAEVRLNVPPVPLKEFGQSLVDELGGTGKILARGLLPNPCWSTPARCAYQTDFQELCLVVQLARPCLSEAGVKELIADLRNSGHRISRIVTAPRVVAEFNEWLNATRLPSRERALFEALLQMRGKTQALYPALLPEFSTERVLCWRWIEGKPFPANLASASRKLRDALVEAVLEQICILGFVDGELDWGDVVALNGGGLAFRRISRPITVPMGRNRFVLRYITSMLSENTADAARWLLELAGYRGSSRMKARLVAVMSEVQPEFSGTRRILPPLAAFVGAWRALSNLAVERPLFVNYLHKNLIALADAQTSPSGIQEAQAAVMGTMLRNRIGDVGKESIKEWAMSSGMVVLESVRYANRMAEELRDDATSSHHSPDPAENQTHLNGSFGYGMLTAILLVAFLLCMRWSTIVGVPWSTVLTVGVVVAGIGMFWSVSRMS